jgi:MoaA/NifB/PqqE/SkfB family radical SAM enzyme
VLPAVCDISVTNLCNATCDFCAFAHDKGLVKNRRFVDRDALARALPILQRRGIAYINLQGGEPLLHPQVEGLVGDAARAGFKVALITNGWQLAQKIEGLIAAGLGTLLVSIDSHSLESHEKNRGLIGVGDRIREGIKRAKRAGLLTIASVTLNKLLCVSQLPVLLDNLGFDAVSFSYPRREPFGSSSMVYGDQSNLVDFKESELLALLEDVKALKRRYRVLNPTAGINDIQRHVRGQDGVFACVGGYRYFYLDWNLQIWRCEAWHEPLGSVFDFEDIPDMRDRCTKCEMSCYRDTSVLMHAGVAAIDAVRHIKAGQPARAAAALFQRSVATSLGAIIQTAPLIWNLKRGSSNRGDGRTVRPQPQSATLIPLKSPARLAD